MSDSPLIPKHIQRRWKNYFIQPAGQIRLVFLYPMLGILSVDALLLVIKSMVISSLMAVQLMYPPNADALLALTESTRSLFNYGFWILAISAVSLAVCGTIISHRYYGPLVPLLRAVRAITKGEYGNRVQLRKGDELTELAEAINALAASLGERSGVPAEASVVLVVGSPPTEGETE
jgi:HAMP domain-containing protein